MTEGRPTGPVLTYCTNVLPAETLAQVRHGLEQIAVPIAADTTGAVGLHLSHAAVEELRHGGESERFAAELRDRGLRVATLNCFPYGGFHDARVKERVYSPGWHEAERERYTLAAAELFARWSPPAVPLPISTLSGTFHAWDAATVAKDAARGLARTAAQLAQLEDRTGREVVLALEPEPFTTLETTPQVLAYFAEHLWAGAGRDELVARGHSKERAESLLRRHLGVCLDTCHQAVEFEDPAESLRALHGAGIRVPKIQLSSALRFTPSAAARPQDVLELARFDEVRYLHQTFARTSAGTLERFVDLGPFLEWWRSTRTPLEEVRSHFHVPVDLPPDPGGPIGTTREALRATLRALHASGQGPGAVLEVETYTFDVLPRDSRVGGERSLEDAVRAELRAAAADWAVAGG